MIRNLYLSQLKEHDEELDSKIVVDKDSMDKVEKDSNINLLEVGRDKVKDNVLNDLNANELNQVYQTSQKEEEVTIVSLAFHYFGFSF